MSVSSIYIEERWLKQDHSYPTHWFQFRVTVAGACPSKSGYKAGPTWTGHPYMAGPLTFTQTGTVSTHQSTSHTQLWDVGGNNGIWRIPHRHGRRCQLHRDSEPSPIDFFLSDGWTKQCYWRATVVDIENAYSEMEAIWRGTSTRVEGRVTWTLKLALKTECEQMV